MKFRGHHLFALIVLAVVLLLIWLFSSGRLAVVTVDGSKKCGDEVKKLCCNEKALEAAKMHPDAIKMKCGACDCSKEGWWTGGSGADEHSNPAEWEWQKGVRE